ncbi:MAG: DNA polymerase III subunit gamma/tau [Aridibacter sp.]
MSYQVIARKWRPQIFEEVIGQEAVTRTLRNAIEHERLHHAYIFSGARGVGKTTTARLLAKALNCRKTDKPNATPCDTDSGDACVSCVEISQSRSMDVFEFDAASHTGVDDIREIILESINVNPARDRYKIFIIDEVHMLSKSSFNALLKTLEEPPANVVFIMATTEKHKVLDTILSRVQDFEFRTIPLQKILNRLKTIAEAENIDISDAGLKEIARSGEGSMRDAQSNFDQVISFSGEKIETEDVINALGLASAENLTTTIQAIADKKPQEILKVIDDLIAHGQDLRHFCTDLLTFIRDLLVFKMAGDAENLLDTAILSFQELEKYSAPFTEADLIRLFNSLAETESKLKDATEPRYLLEVGLIKLCEMGRVQPVEQLLERLANLEKLLNNSDFNTENIQPTETPEKKTLISRTPPEDTPFPVKSGEVEEVSDENNFIEDFSENDLEAEISVQEISVENEEFDDEIIETEIIESPIEFDVSAMPVKLEPIEAEELEHIGDKWLDKAFERILLKEGDNLKWIKNAEKIVKALNLNDSETVSVKSEIPNQSNGSATAFAPAKDNKALEIVAELARVEEIDETIPELPDNPTEEELWKYAENHPKVKKVLRVFRGKLIDVKKD